MKSLRLVLLFVLLLALTNKAEAKIPILYSNGEEIEKVMTLPSEYTIQASDGQYYHADLGILHKQFSLFYIPLVNYGDETYVLYTDTKVGDYDETYVPISNSDIMQLQQSYPDIPTTPELPFWDAWGGKLLVFILFGLIFFKRD